MIRYSLTCDEAHVFEAWFRDSLAFDDQVSRGHVGCPLCGSEKVRKSLMAPSIRRSSRSEPAEVPAVAAEPASAGPEDLISMDDAKRRVARAMIRELHSRIRESAEDVGRTFPVEARKIHEGEVPARPIYGTATADEVKDLLDDGIGVLPLPPSPDEGN